MPKKLLAGDRLIVALDYTQAKPALDMARSLRGAVRTLKIGSILFTACGPDIVNRVRRMGFDVMLDLKFYDIPSTVELSVRAATGLGVSLLTVHATGEKMMLSAAVAGAREEARRLKVPSPKILAVTVLTSADPAKGKGLDKLVLELAGRAAQSGCDGVVCSAQEAPLLRKHFGKRLMLVCPGIRPANAEAQDQRRITTPAQALALGADKLVVGRPITAAADPANAARSILNDMEARTHVKER